MTNSPYHKRRRQLRPDKPPIVDWEEASFTTSSFTKEEENESASLTQNAMPHIIGYDSEGNPIYEEPCYSNDNLNPHTTNCTEVPTSSPTGINAASGSEEEGENATEYYTYECNEEEDCNEYPPGNSQGIGWVYVGNCKRDIDCPSVYNEDTEYSKGDKTSISSDTLNSQVTTSESCPGFESSEEGNEANDGEVNDENSVVVPYVYGVDSTVTNANVFLPRLEEQILSNLAGSMMSCHDGNRKLVTTDMKEKGMMLRRHVLKNEMTVRKLEGSAEFSVGGIESAPADVAIDRAPCTISSEDADSCFVIEGSLTLLLDPIEEDSSYDPSASAEAATDAAQSNLDTAMANDDLLSPNMPEVMKVTYLGDSYDDYASGVGNGEWIGNFNPEDPSNSGIKPFDDGSGGLMYGIIGGILGTLLVVLFALLLVKRRRTKSRNEAHRGRELDSQAVGMDWDEWNERYDYEGALAAGRKPGEITYHVGNLSPNTTQEQIVELFEAYGKVTNCIIPQDHLSDDLAGRSQEGRFALLTMPAYNETELEQAENACSNINCSEFDGHILTVHEVTTLYVGNLSSKTNEDGLRELFEQYGQVFGCLIPDDHQDAGNVSLNNSRFALVTMPVDNAQNAIAHLNGMEVDGSVITVRDTRYMNGGRGIPGGGLAVAALAAGCLGVFALFNAGLNDEVIFEVSNMSPNTSVDDIQDLFKGYGDVLECVIPLDEEDITRESGNRLAFVTMPAEQAFYACNALNGYELDGYNIRVREVHRRSRGSGMRNLMDDSASCIDGDEMKPGLLGTLGALVGGIFLLKACRKKSEDNRLAHLESDNEQSLDAGLDAIINNIDDATAAHDRRNFVVDPPGAFHMGNHHYTKDGVRYFSPLCDQCIAARSDVDGVFNANGHNQKDLDLTETNDLSFDLEKATKFTDFNANDLGRYHSSMHVRHCKSTTCAICIKEKGVFFVKSRRELSSDDSNVCREVMM